MCAWFQSENTPSGQRTNAFNQQHGPIFQPQMTFPYRIFDHAILQHTSPHSSFGVSASVAPLGSNYQQSSFGMSTAPLDADFDYAFQNHLVNGLEYAQSHSWLASQQSWMHAYPAESQVSYHADMSAEAYAAAYAAHSGMAPHSNIVSWRQNITTGDAGNIPVILEPSATHADVRKSSLRRERSSTHSITSSEQLQARNVPDTLSRTSSHQASSQDVRQNSEDVESSENSWEDSSEEVSVEGSVLVNLRSTQALAIDERKAYLLRHFVNNIRPCLSISEPPLKFDGSSTWGEILPSLALSCPGLLHGLMAASALHLAVLHGTSEAVPMKHFMVASKRLHNLLGAPDSRHQLETLSLCLLLAWYEVMNADHARWIMHLGGASSFLLEHIRVAGIPPGMLSHEGSIVDEQLIESLTGFSVDYTAGSNQFMQNAIFENDMSYAAEREWKARQDLFWWYIKMDVYHALLSGDQLLLSYDKWGLCPPRGRIGSIDQVHATFDHLWLVLGRLADFGGRDRFRKQRQVVASGGQWKPPPNFPKPTEKMMKLENENSESSGGDGMSCATKAGKASSSSRKGPPMNFYGMMPPPTIPPSMLSSFHVNDAEMRKHLGSQQSPPKPSSSTNLRVETERALLEHDAIRDALERWKSSLRADFGSFTETTTQLDCPFSPPLQYSDPLIASMWGLYYLGRILLCRYHPHSPPAMMMSAGVNAKLTHEDAQKIGRIHAGLVEQQAELAKVGAVNPTLVAALEEMSFALMFAGTQYESAQQRLWTIDNLVELAKSAGWKSAYAVASALETAWVTQGDMGKGPPYERTLHQKGLHDAPRYDRGSTTSKKLFRHSQSEHESRFVSHDRGLITTYADARAYWAIGVLSSADDVQVMFERANAKSEKD